MFRKYVSLKNVLLTLLVIQFIVVMIYILGYRVYVPYVTDRLENFVTLNFTEEQKLAHQNFKIIEATKEVPVVYSNYERIGVTAYVGDTIKFWVSSVSAFDCNIAKPNLKIKLEVVDTDGSITTDGVLFKNEFITNCVGLNDKSQYVIFKQNNFIHYRIRFSYPDRKTIACGYSPLIVVKNKQANLPLGNDATTNAKR